MTKVAIHWFRHDLRLHDNPALLKSLDGCEEFYPIFIFDGKVAGTDTAGYNRMRFLHETLADLDRNLERHGGRLFVFNGNPVELFTHLFQEWGVTHLSFEDDPECVWRERDDAVRALCKEFGVECICEISHTLWNPHEIIKKNGGHPPHTFLLFKQVADYVGLPSRPVSDPHLEKVNMPVPDDFEERYALKPLWELGYEPECAEQQMRINEWLGGESHALKLLERRLALEEEAYSTGHIMESQYKPDLVGPPTSLSPQLRFGCLSVRRFFWGLRDTFTKVQGKDPPLSLTAQLLWREFFYIMSVNNPAYDRIKGNPICLQVPWQQDKDMLKKWENGKTGYPWIDACMVQLKHEGWMHHVGRHAVSCFLTRGDLWISWEEGLKVFEKYLLDADWSVCAGNWMWVSSSAFEKCLQCPRCFSPVMYGMRMDPTGEYVRRYLPVLKNMPLKYLFQPWKAPRDVQEEAGCIVGRDYPEPVVDHSVVSKRNRSLMEEFKSCLKDPEIMHCAPSNEEEVLKFCWLTDQRKTNQFNMSNHLCEGKEEL